MRSISVVALPVEQKVLTSSWTHFLSSLSTIATRRDQTMKCTILNSLAWNVGLKFIHDEFNCRGFYSSAVWPIESLKCTPWAVTQSDQAKLDLIGTLGVCEVAVQSKLSQDFTFARKKGVMSSTRPSVLIATAHGISPIILVNKPWKHPIGAGQ